jgi:hypothetical protein
MVFTRSESPAQSLQKMYDFEVLSPESVRPFVHKSLDVSEEKTNVQTKKKLAEQFHFDFGLQFRDGISSFKLSEPLDTLGLSPLAFKAIASFGMKTIGELALLSQDRSKILQIKGLGPGHVDEILEKLKRALGDEPFAKRHTIDCLALIRGLFHGMEIKERYLFLSRYQLGFLFPIKPYDQLEVEKWSLEQQEKVFLRARETLRQNHLGTLRAKLEEITFAIILPWLEARCGFAKRYEIEERLFTVVESEQERQLLQTLKLFSEILGSTYFCFEHFLCPISDDIFAQSEDILKNFFRVEQQAKDYFYSPQSVYPLKKILCIIERDFTLQWESLSHKFIEKVLRTTSNFTIFRNSAGTVCLQPKNGS